MRGLLGLSQRAQHPPEQLRLLHGSLFNIKCTDFYCNYSRDNDFTDPIVPALAIPKKSSVIKTEKKEPDTAEQKNEADDESDQKQIKKSEEATKDESDEEIDISDIGNHIPSLSVEELPQCPKCNGLLRPGVVWFGEPLPTGCLEFVDEWIESEPVDLMLVIGTSSNVYPAAGYVDVARENGARIAVVNMEPYSPRRGEGLRKEDWFFQGDASVIVPEILKSVIGEI